MCADRALRVLQVVPESTGGIGAHVRMLTQELRRRGHQLTLAAPAATLARLAPASAAAVEVALPVGSLSATPGLRRRLRDLADEHDVTHAHGVRAAAQAAVSVGGPLVVTWHNAPLGGPLRHALHAALEQVGARRSAVVLGASPDLVERARVAGSRDARLCELPAPSVAGSGQDRAGTHRGRPTVLAIGRLHPQKRLDLLIAAAAGWETRADAPEVVIAGDGPLADSLREQVRRTHAPVRFLGQVSDVGPLLDSADVVALPSDWEARPFVAQEALRAGVPLVATDVGGVRHLVGDAAVLVPPDDAVALRRGIEAVLDSSQLRERLRTEGPRRAATWPSVADMVTMHEELYLEVRSRFMRQGH